MKYFFDEITEQSVSQLLGRPVRINRGDIETGEMEEEEMVNGTKVMMPVTRKGIEVFEDDLTPAELVQLNAVLANHQRLKRFYEVPSLGDLPASDVIARVKSIDVQAAKPVVCVRLFEGQEFDIPCLVTENIKDQYIGGHLGVGDWVILTYCEHDYPNQAIITAKVFKSWN